MGRLALGAAFFASLLAHSLSAAPLQTIDFDLPAVTGSPGSVTFDGPLSGLGLNFTANPSAFAIAGTQVGAPPPGSGITGNYITVNSAGMCPWCGPAPSSAVDMAVVSLRFVHPGSTQTQGVFGNTLQLILWDENYDPNHRVIIYAYDLNGNLIEVINWAPPMGTDFGTVVFTTTAIIGWIDIVDFGGDGFIFDFLIFEPVPEPGTLALMAGGLAAVAVFRRLRLRKRPAS